MLWNGCGLDLFSEWCEILFVYFVGSCEWQCVDDVYDGYFVDGYVVVVLIGKGGVI